MNYSLKQLVLPVVMLMPLLSTEAVGDSCVPTGAAYEKQKALTVCQDSTSSNYSLNFDLGEADINNTLGTELPFQIRSCGHESCNRATEFAIFTWDSDWVQGKINLVSGQSKIPLSVKVKQNETKKPVSLPVPRFPNCKQNINSCDFSGSGLTAYPGGVPDPLDCPDCVKFELHVNADLKDLITQGTLSSSGKHTGHFWLGIQQHKESANIGSGDSGYQAWVSITISLDVPDLIQISGLKDLTLTPDNLTAPHEFCVYRILDQKFSITADGEHDNGYYFRLNNGAEYIGYDMYIGHKSGTQTQIFGSDWVNYEEDWSGDCKSFGDNINGDTNMSLKIVIPPDKLNGKPSGVYKDTMTLTVQPE